MHPGCEPEVAPPSPAQAPKRIATYLLQTDRGGHALHTSKLAFTSLVGTLAFLGLAILGWGGFAAFFSNPARIALTVVVFALTGAALLSPGNLSLGRA